MNYFTLTLTVLFVAGALSCQKKKEKLEEIPVQNKVLVPDLCELLVPFKTNYQTFLMPVTTDFNPLPIEIGAVSMSEASGLGYSRKNKGMIWAHNDSGNSNSLYLIDAKTGEISAIFEIEGTVNFDWEDMEVAVGPEDGESYLYVADTGDNREGRPDYTIYRFKEPQYDSTQKGTTIKITDWQVDEIKFKYADGSHDTEAMFVDPHTKDIFLVTKRDVVSMMYVLPFPQKNNEIFSICKVGEFSFREASAATCSADGTKILIKNRQDIFYWQRTDNETTLQMLARTPPKAPYVGEPQGEAICFDTAYHYFTLSEELNQETKPILYHYLSH